MTAAILTPSPAQTFGEPRRPQPEPPPAKGPDVNPARPPVIPTWIPDDGPCQFCKELGGDADDAGRKARKCDDCGKPIPVYLGMGGSGYESATVAHYHLEAAGSRTLRTPVMRELCRECYRVDYQVQFPGSPDPV